MRSSRYLPFYAAPISKKPANAQNTEDGLLAILNASERVTLLDLSAFLVTDSGFKALADWITDRQSTLGRILWHPSQVETHRPWVELIEKKLVGNRAAFLDRPRDILYGYCSQQAYRDDGGNLPLESGWVKECVYDNTRKDGYFGVAYRHDQQGHYVVAHRGTNPAHLKELFKDICTDVEGIVRAGITSQQISAFAFAMQIKQMADAKDYRVSFTGHSLGGWLAQVCVYHLVGQDYRTHAVVFDSPGSSDMLTLLQPDDVTARIDISQLDVTNYLSAPNLINTCSRHPFEVGTLYRTYPTLPPPEGIGQYFYSTLGGAHYNLNAHSLNGIMATFDAALGRPQRLERMLKWPHTMWPEGYKPQASLGQWVGQLASWIMGFKLPGLLTHTLAQKVMDKVPFAKEIGGLVQVLEDFADDKFEQSQYQAFHHYVSYGNQFKPDFNSLSQESSYRLHHEGHYDAIAFNERSLPLRHFGRDVVDFLKRYEKYQVVYKDHLDIAAFFEIAGLSKSEQAETLHLLHFHIDDKSNLLVGEQSIVKTAVDFRCRVVALLTYYPELKQLKGYKYASIYQRLTELESLTDTQGQQSLLKAIQAKVDEQWETNYELLQKLTALYPQARLYLYGVPTAEELKQHEVESEQLAKQLALNQRVQSQLQALKARLQASTHQNQDLAQAMTQLEADVFQQREQLQLAELMNQAMRYQKRQCFKEAQATLDTVLQLLTKSSDDKVTTKTTLDAFDTIPGLRRAQLFASVYTLQGKIYRTSQPKDKWPETVLKSYDLALSQTPDNATIWSSKGALLDDMGRHLDAEVCHRQALRLQKPNVAAVTLSNLGWSLYHQAIAQQPFHAEKLKEALYYYEHSLKQKPYLAGTWLYRGLLLQALQKDAEALEDFNQGLQQQPDYIKLLFERAKLHAKLNKYSEAERDAKQALQLLHTQASISPDYQELLLAVTAFVASNPVTPATQLGNS